MAVPVDAVAGPRPVTEVDAPAPLFEPAAHAPRRKRVTTRRVLILFLVLGLSTFGTLTVLHVRASRRRRSALAPIATVLDPRPRLLRAVLSAIDLRRRPPRVVERDRDGLTDALRALRRPRTPRVLPYVTIKRTNPHVGDTFGHWWVEIDGTESYGWWPDRCPIRVRDFFFGGKGTLNGMGGSCGGGTTVTDPHHLEPADHSFHPTLVVRKRDRRVRADLRAFAQRFTGGWRWSTKPTSDECRSFQLRLLEAAGLEEGDEHFHTRGPGCPFLALFRPRVREFATAADGTKR